MAAGVVLTTLTNSGVGVSSAGKANFDLSRLYDARLKLQVAQALDLGFQHRNGTGLMARTTSDLENAASHGVRFFSVAAEALAGTGLPPIGGEGGFSLWCHRGVWNVLAAPVLERTDMRVSLNPTGGNYSVRGDGFAYNRLFHILWHELHHLTSTRHHIRMDAPYDDGDPWVGEMREIGRAFPSTARDPETGQQVRLFEPDQWTASPTGRPTG